MAQIIKRGKHHKQTNQWFWAPFIGLAIFALPVPPAHGARSFHQQIKRRLIHYRNTVAGVRYVGSAVCARCHSQIYQEYLRTAMGRSMTLPTDPSQLTMPQAPFALYIEKFHRHYAIFRRGGELYQSDYETGADGKAVFRDTQKISYLIGAGENGISYLVPKGNYLFEAPLSYYTRLHSWALSPGYEHGDAGFHRQALPECVVCHSGRPQPLQVVRGLYKDPPFRELAIGCENCHGPGQLHVEERMKRAPLTGAPEDSIDRSIVNPANLPAWLADDICMMCHEIGDARILQPGKSYLDFRPGTPLDYTIALFSVPLTPASPPQTPLLQQYAQMVLSKCYRASRGQMTCLTCHDPHFEPSVAQAPAYFRKRCLICHTERSCTVPLAQRLRQATPDNCIGCHMPRRNLREISHSALTNHRIIAYSDEPLPQAAFHQTTRLLPDLVHVDAIPGQETTMPAPIVLLQAYGGLMATHPEYKAQYNKVLEEAAAEEPNDPVVLLALARAHLLEGSVQGLGQARAELSRAVTSGSATAPAYELYGYVLQHSGETGVAIDTLKRGIAVYPYATHLYVRLALMYGYGHEYGKALSTMKQELNIFPEDPYVRRIVQRLENAAGPP